MSVALQPSLQPAIATERLYMRPVDPEKDLDACVALYGGEKETLFFESGPKTKEETVQYIHQFATEQFQNFGLFGIYTVFQKEDDAFVGHADLFTIDQEQEGDLEIGFILKEEYQGKKYGTEIAFALKNMAQDLYSQNHPRVKRLVATAHPLNTPSWKILEKLGMQFIKQEDKFNGPRKVYRLEFSTPKAL